MDRRHFLQWTTVSSVTAASLLAGRAVGQQMQAKVALLVGVNQYARRGFRPLSYAERDVTEFSKLLEAQGFTEVRLLLGSVQGKERATKANIERAVDELLEQRRASDLVLLAFAGHGEQRPLLDDKGVEKKTADNKSLEDAYFCPVDAVQNESPTLVSLTKLMGRLDRKGGINLVMVDACRDNPDPSRSSRSITGNELVDRLPSNTAIIFSCAASQQAWETDTAGKGHGVFFYHVLEGLRGEASKKNGDVTWGSLVEYVVDHTNDRAKEWLPKEAEYWATRRMVPLADLPFQTPHELKNLISQPVLARITASKPMPIVEPALLKAPFGESEARSAQRAWASYLKREVLLSNKLGMKLSLIPPGEFEMGSLGSEADRSANEHLHRVRISRPFYLGVYEVTQEEWQAVMGSNPSEFSRSGSKSNDVSGLDTSRFPVEAILWEDASEFCRKLSAREGIEYRLPTEAEWEYACRAGTSSVFSFGDDSNGDRANVNGIFPYGTSTKGKYLKRTAQVGSYAANAFGLYDMHGNVWEWCRDYYAADYYQSAPTADPENTTSDKYNRRVCRGGSWYYRAGSCRSAIRYGDIVFERDMSIGFRVCHPVR